MSQILEIEMSDEVLSAMQQDGPHFAGEMRLAAAVKWYELGLLSQEKAADAAGLSRAAFISEMARFNVSPFQETAAEILAFVQNPPA